KETRSFTRVIQSTISIKRWTTQMPSPADVRPKQCSGCSRAAAPLGERIVVVGHGTRRRNVLGPCGPGDAVGTLISILARRFRCRGCGAVLLVVPLGVLPVRRYCAFAIAWALALFGLLGLSASEVRERVTSWRREPHTANLGWPALKRWARDVRD